MHIFQRLPPLSFSSKFGGIFVSVSDVLPTSACDYTCIVSHGS